MKVERRIDLVYGGGSIGLMGLVSQAVHDGGRHVLGFALSLSLSLLCVDFDCRARQVHVDVLFLFFFEMARTILRFTRLRIITIHTATQLMGRLESCTCVIYVLFIQLSPQDFTVSGWSPNIAQRQTSMDQTLGRAPLN